MNPCRRLIGTEAYVICIEEIKEYMRRRDDMTAESWNTVKGVVVLSGNI